LLKIYLGVIFVFSVSSCLCQLSISLSQSMILNLSSIFLSISQFILGTISI
jgi:hypothetical protein